MRHHEVAHFPATPKLRAVHCALVSNINRRTSVPELILTYRGVVYPWQCDHMGHMNVMWYKENNSWTISTPHSDEK
jgi:hypothetical protein